MVGYWNLIYFSRNCLHKIGIGVVYLHKIDDDFLTGFKMANVGYLDLSSIVGGIGCGKNDLTKYWKLFIKWGHFGSEMTESSLRSFTRFN